MKTFLVPYIISSGMGEANWAGTAVVQAKDDLEAEAEARAWIEENDAHYDVRIDPKVKIGVIAEDCELEFSEGDSELEYTIALIHQLEREYEAAVISDGPRNPKSAEINQAKAEALAEVREMLVREQLLVDILSESVLEQAKKDMLNSVPMFSAKEANEKVSAFFKSDSSSAENLVSLGILIKVEDNGQTLFPQFQFDLPDYLVNPTVATVNLMLGADQDSLAVLSWWVSSSNHLPLLMSPVDLLGEDDETILMLAIEEISE